MMTGGELSVEMGWLIAGALLIALEAFGIPGVGFLFAGLASIVVALLVYAGVLEQGNLVLQLGAFGALTGLLALLLWKKLKTWRINPNATDQFSNIIGDMAVVGKGGIEAGSIGQVSWSGTTMMAQLDPTCTDASLTEGSMVEITAVKGNQLFVAPKPKSA